MPITKIRKEPKVSASNVNVSPGKQLDDALTAIGAALDAKANAADVAAVTGQRSSLNTTDKSNLVAAINEVKGDIPTSYNELTDKPIIKTSGNGFVIVAQGTNRANMATAQNAFADGNGTYAAGVASHSEGSDTYAAAANSHAEGNGKVVVMLKQAYTQGDLTIVTDVPYPADTELESPRTQERVSVVSVQESQGVYICTLAHAFSEDIATNQPLNVYGGALGVNSHAEGCGTIAAHDSTHSEGYGTIANGIYAKASGEKSYALGRASEAAGQGTQALNEAEHASGKYNKSTSNVTQFSVGIGADGEHRANAYEVTTDGKMYVKGVGGYDGTNVTSNNVDDLATAIAQGGGGGTQDYNDLLNKPIYKKENEDGYVLDHENSASDIYTLAEGHYTTASAACSHAEGAYTEASGGFSHAEGWSTTASGVSSHAEGDSTEASGSYSHAGGFHTMAFGHASHAEGSYTKAYSANSFVCGTYNKPDITTLFAVGYGTDSSPKDAVHVDYDGNVYIQGIGGYTGDNLGQSRVESVQEVIARLERALGGNNS